MWSVKFAGSFSFSVVFIIFASIGYGCYVPFMNFAPADLNFIVRNIPAGQNVAVFVPDSVAESRVLKLAVSSSIHFSRFASNGKPDSWDQGKSEFQVLGEPGIPIRRYRFWYRSSEMLDKHKIIPEHFKNPGRIIVSPETGSQIWFYNDNQGSRIDEEIMDSLQGRFRIECL